MSELSPPSPNDWVTLESLFSSCPSDQVVHAHELSIRIHKWVCRSTLWSSNESIDELANGTLRFILAAFYEAHFTGARLTTDPSERLVNLLKSEELYLEFLHDLSSLGCLEPPEILRLRLLEDSNEPLVISREDKVSAFNRKKRISSQIERITARCRVLRGRSDFDEEDEEGLDREYRLAVLQNAGLEALSEIEAVRRELEMLRFGAKMRLMSAGDVKSMYESEGVPKKPEMFQINSDHQVRKLGYTQTNKHISRIQELTGATSLDDRISSQSMNRETLLRQRNPWTVSIEDAIEEEMRNMIPAEIPQTPLEEEDASILADREDMLEAEIIKKRNWDDWADDHEKGLGKRGLA